MTLCILYVPMYPTSLPFENAEHVTDTVNYKTTKRGKANNVKRNSKVCGHIY